MLSFEEYHQEYLKAHPLKKKPLNFPNKQKKNFKEIFFSTITNYKTLILLMPFIFTFALNLIISQTFKDNYLSNQENILSSKVNIDLLPRIVNKIYSEQIIDKINLSNIDLSNDLKSTSLEIKKNNLIKKKKKLIENNLVTLNNKNYLDSVLVKWKKNFSQKKIEFIETILPIIVYQNQKTLIKKNKLIEIKELIEINKTLSDKDISFVKRVAKKYSVNTNSKHKIDIIDELLISVNIIPNSIVLAQAANESGWGSSRFAKEHNALFGQYTYDINSGTIPEQREVGKKHLIKVFLSIDKSVESYFLNINTHHAYKEFRDIRNILNINNLNQSVKSLTKALGNYAEDKLYVKTLNSIIDNNNLTQFDLINLSFSNS